MSFTDLLANDLVTVSRPTITHDGSGGAKHVPYTVQEDVPARVESLSSDQQLRFSQPEIPVTHRVFIDDVTLVKNGDLLTTSDDLVIRVKGIEQRRGLGGIDNFAVILGEEIKV